MARRAVTAVGAAAALALTVPLSSHAEEARWSRENLDELVIVARDATRLGLDPEDYATAALEAVIATNDLLAVEIAASALYSRLAHDLADGVTPAGARRRWRIDKTPIDEASVAAAMETALAAGDIRRSIDSFAPQHAEYGALAAAFAVAEDARTRETLRVNLERWRWMPADLGPDYLLINPPSYEAILVRGGEVKSRRRVIVGALKTPTPQFSATITGISINPTWYVPASIVAESVGDLLKDKPKEAARQGYYVAVDGGVRQKPGPANALGRMKLVMPNPLSVFVHDTPNRKNFDLELRALSHGCVRIDEALDVAAELLGDGWNRKMIDNIADTGSTVTIETPAPIPVYIGYFTAMTDAGGAVRFYPDIYGLDRTVFAERAAAPVASTQDIASLCVAG